MTPVHGLSLTSDRPIANLEQMSSCQVGEVRGILRIDYRYPASCYRLSLSLDRASLLELGRESVPLAPPCLLYVFPEPTLDSSLPLDFSCASAHSCALPMLAKQLSYSPCPVRVIA